MSLFNLGKKNQQASLEAAYPTLASLLAEAGIKEVDQAKDGSINLTAEVLQSLETTLAEASANHQQLAADIEAHGKELKAVQAAVAKAQEAGKAIEAKLTELEAERTEAETALTAALEAAEVTGEHTLATGINALAAKVAEYGAQPGEKPTSAFKAKDKDDEAVDPEAAYLTDADKQAREIHAQFHGNKK